MDNIAITFGRYDIVTLGHVSFLKEMLKKWDYITIGVLRITNLKPQGCHTKFKDFLELCDLNHNSTRNLFTLEQRIAMWEIVIDKLDLRGRVIATPMNRPEYFPLEFSLRYPPNIYDLTFPVADSGFDLKRNEVFGKILNRNIQVLKPDLIVHSSEIKNNIETSEFIFDEVREYIFSHSGNSIIK